MPSPEPYHIHTSFFQPVPLPGTATAKAITRLKVCVGGGQQPLPVSVLPWMFADAFPCRPSC
ncbi:MAG: hypothetical protein OXC57_15000, partial [Rhodobacteraceae bacterium]|nr:hypothetical protein [Paracoccaceae bacterium]